MATAEPGIGNLKKIIDRVSQRGLDNVTSGIHWAAIRVQHPQDSQSPGRVRRQVSGHQSTNPA